mmetsp:Transcript_36070/g.86399  ORF Transcript_36070/g.86399 Transcript_36070/m.86399 type:complete len:235 (+) Transcript_36070:1361-2065(+)
MLAACQRTRHSWRSAAWRRPLESRPQSRAPPETAQSPWPPPDLRATASPRPLRAASRSRRHRAWKARRPRSPGSPAKKGRPPAAVEAPAGTPREPPQTDPRAPAPPFSGVSYPSGSALGRAQLKTPRIHRRRPCHRTPGCTHVPAAGRAALPSLAPRGCPRPSRAGSRCQAQRCARGCGLLQPLAPAWPAQPPLPASSGTPEQAELAPLRAQPAACHSDFLGHAPPPAVCSAGH